MVLNKYVMSKSRFVVRFLFFGLLIVILLFQNFTISHAGCEGIVKCIAQDSYGVCSPPISSALGCSGAGSPAACAASETNYATGCDDSGACAIGGCYWVESCGDGMCDSSESATCPADCGSPPTPAPGCTGSWSNLSCGAGSCSSNQMQQRRTYSDSWTIQSVDLASGNTGIATGTSLDLTSPYRTNATSVAESTGQSIFIRLQQTWAIAWDNVLLVERSMWHISQAGFKLGLI